MPPADDWRKLYPFDSHLIALDRARMHYLDEGSGQPLLMVHGNPTWSFYWRNLVIAFRDQPNLLIAARFGSPLVIGVGRGEYFISSDASPLVGRTDRIVYLADHQIAVLAPEGFSVLHRDQGKVRVDIRPLEADSGEVSLEGFDHYMLKEIYEQPQALAAIVHDLMKSELHTEVLDTRLDRGDWEAVARAHGRRFGSIRPANTLVQADLVGTDYLVEVEAEAIVSDG